jgi:hypothetical protein
VADPWRLAQAPPLGGSTSLAEPPPPRHCTWPLPLPITGERIDRDDLSFSVCIWMTCTVLTTASYRRWMALTL